MFTHETHVTDKALEKAREFALGREEQNRNGKNARAYDHDGLLPYTSLQASTFAIVAEIAAAKVLGLDKDKIEWVIPKDNYRAKGLSTNADLRYTNQHGREWKIEIRNAAATHNPLPIKKKDHQDDLIVVHAYVVPDQITPGGNPLRGISEPTNTVQWLNWAYGSDYANAFWYDNGTYKCKRQKAMSSLEGVLNAA